MYESNELKHYGVLGMKWGKRKARPVSELKSRYDKAKAAKKAAYKQYSKDFNKSSTLYGAWGPGNKQRHEKTYDSAVRTNKADAEFRAVKKERKTAIKNTYKDIQKNTKLGEKLLYNNATRKKAAKYVVDNNMSVSDAKKKANKEAIRNTAIMLGAIGAYKLYESGALTRIANNHGPVFKTKILDKNGKTIARKFSSSVIR